MSDVQMGPYSAVCNESTGSITVTDGAGQSLEMATGECAAAVEAVAFGASLLDVPVLPPEITFNLFSLEFTETGNFLVGRGGRVAFDKSNQEDLIRVIDIALNKTTDSMRLRGGPRRGVSAPGGADPVI
jgi:hypothetical protein